MDGLRIKLGPFEFELSEKQTDNVTFTVFCAMVAVAVITGLVLLT